MKYTIGSDDLLMNKKIFFTKIKCFVVFVLVRKNRQNNKVRLLLFESFVTLS